MPCASPARMIVREYCAWALCAGVPCMGTVHECCRSCAWALSMGNVGTVNEYCAWVLCMSVVGVVHGYCAWLFSAVHE